MILKVLIVDDKEDNRFVLRDALDGEGYELLEAANGREALALTERESLDLVLLDIMMPEMDGIECCRQLKADEATADIPVVLVTALGDDAHVIEGLNAGATDYIAKPFKGPVVRARARAALRSKTAHDILKQQKDRIALLADALERKNVRLADLTDTAHRFVDNVAHEFRTPLAVIKEFSSIIADGLGGPVTDAQTEYLEFIESATCDLAQMVDDFLDSSRLKAGMLRVDRSPRAIANVIDHVLPILTARARVKQVRVVDEVNLGAGSVFADAEKVGRVIINLGVNAIKFSPEGGEVRIWAQTASDGGTEIGITDQGPGLSPEDVECVFERFKQVGDVERASTKGFGLGLNIAKELIWINLGTVNVHSELGQGSTFSFTLPPCDPEGIVDRYFNRLAELNDPPLTMAILQAGPLRPAELEDLRRLLVSVSYPMDLILPAEDGTSIALLGATAEPDRWVARIRSAHAEKRASGTADLVRDYHMEHVGSWSFDNRDRLAAFVLDAVKGRRACA